MKFVAYPSADVVGSAYYQQRAGTMMETFITAIRKQVKREQAYAEAIARRDLDFVHMATGLLGEQAQIKMDAQKLTAAELEDKLSIN